MTHPTREEPTYQTFVIHQILPPLGWQAVFGAADGTHRADPVDLLALVTRRRRGLYTGGVLPSVLVSGSDSEEEGREVVGLDYDAGGTGFHPCDDLDNYCGLLPPGVALEDFLADHHCGVATTKETR